ncbi:hypothetical protein IQE94_17170 [Synechocystis sp. PCC 7339]|nr:hypothetical protein [Synechocystis sp. PCC 7339]UAJ72732.1 hypothetical protein IQE94_17170 [Synechocystis sp. PCC 7339]
MVTVLQLAKKQDIYVPMILPLTISSLELGRNSFLIVFASAISIRS